MHNIINAASYTIRHADQKQHGRLGPASQGSLRKRGEDRFRRREIGHRALHQGADRLREEVRD